MCTPLHLFLNTILLYCVINLNNCETRAQSVVEQNHDFNVLVDGLYSLYKDSFQNGKVYQTRRMLINDKSYALHVKKLKEVNGLKRHNLKVEGMGLRSHPIVYINNPVESAVPNAYLTIDQFKNAMIHKAEDKKKEFNNEFIHKNQKTEKPKKEVKKVKHRAKATTKAHSERSPKFVRSQLKKSPNRKNPTKPITKKRTARKLTARKLTTRKLNARKLTTRKMTARELTTRKLISRKLTTKKPTTRKLTARKQTTRKLTTIKKIQKVVNKVKQVINIPIKSTTEKPTQGSTTASLVQNKTASLVTKATVQNNHVNVTNEILATKTTILRQNVTDAKFETKSVTEILTNVTEIPPNVTEIPTNVTEEPTIVTETPIVTDTITTVTEPSTTETTTVKTKRTKQARPYVFMGGS
ncbi:uncharacterized protein LOC135118167 [Helicoverpa armigera]|uniref:uncharacterized protein LOC135118167 n=1 Tax=Helicoverpa armigera TaxID=29058 RepID=UPI003083BF92